MKSIKDLLTPDQLAEKLGLSRDLIDQWRKQLGLPYMQVGKIIFIYETSFMSWMKGQEKGGNRQDALQRDLFKNKGGTKDI